MKNKSDNRAFSHYFISIFIFAQLIIVSAHSSEADSINQAYGSGHNFFIDFYQKYISATRGDDICPMYPSCSQYAKLAFKNQGPLSAYLSICSRLLCCGHDRSTYPGIIVDGKLKLSDPAPAPTDSVDSSIQPKTIPSVSICPESERIQLRSYADHLMENGNFLKAYEYYTSDLFQTTADSLRQILICSLISASYHAHPPSEFKRIFYDYVNDMDTLSRSACGLYLSKSAFVSCRYTDVLNAVKNYRSEMSTKDQKYQYQVLSGLSYLGNYDFKNAKQALDSVAYYGKYINFDEYNRSIEQLRHTKNASVAGIISAIIPGSGFLYAGKPSTALVSLIINGLFIGSAMEMFKDKKYFFGSTISFLGFGWYFGSIRGSIKAARDYNYALRQSVIMNFARDADLNFN